MVLPMSNNGEQGIVILPSVEKASVVIRVTGTPSTGDPITQWFEVTALLEWPDQEGSCALFNIQDSNIQNVSLNDSYIIYPNPSNSIWNYIIKSDMVGKQRLRLINGMGQEIMYLTAIAGEVLQIPSSTLSAGFYFLEVIEEIDKDGIRIENSEKIKIKLSRN